MFIAKPAQECLTSWSGTAQVQDLLPSLGVCCDEFLLNNWNLSPSCYESVARRCLFVGLRAILGDTGHFLPDFSRFPRMEYWLNDSLSSTDLCPNTLPSASKLFQKMRMCTLEKKTRPSLPPCDNGVGAWKGPGCVCLSPAESEAKFVPPHSSGF